jgi:hypothetical protein
MPHKHVTQSQSATRSKVSSLDLKRAQKIFDLGYKFGKDQDLDKLTIYDLEPIYETLVWVFEHDPARGNRTDEAITSYVRYWLPRIRKGVYSLHDGKAWGMTLVTHVNLWVPKPGQEAGNTFKSAKSGQYVPFKDNRNPRSQVTPIKADDYDVLHASKTEKDWLAHRLAELFLAVNGYVKRCPLIRCRKIFVASGKKIYCSEKCSGYVRQLKHQGQDLENVLTTSTDGSIVVSDDEDTLPFIDRRPKTYSEWRRRHE